MSDRQPGDLPEFPEELQDLSALWSAKETFRRAGFGRLATALEAEKESSDRLGQAIQSLQQTRHPSGTQIATALMYLDLLSQARATMESEFLRYELRFGKDTSD